MTEVVTTTVSQKKASKIKGFKPFVTCDRSWQVILSANFGVASDAGVPVSKPPCAHFAPLSEDLSAIEAKALLISSDILSETLSNMESALSNPIRP